MCDIRIFRVTGIRSYSVTIIMIRLKANKTVTPGVTVARRRRNECAIPIRCDDDYRSTHVSVSDPCLTGSEPSLRTSEQVSSALRGVVWSCSRLPAAWPNGTLPVARRTSPAPAGGGGLALRQRSAPFGRLNKCGSMWHCNLITSNL